MRLIAVVAVFVCVALGACAEKSETQRVSDAVKAKLAQRGKPNQISCRQPPVRGRDQAPGYWACSATLQHPRTPYALCGSWDDPERPFVACRFSRTPPPKHPEILVIR